MNKGKTSEPRKYGLFNTLKVIGRPLEGVNTSQNVPRTFWQFQLRFGVWSLEFGVQCQSQYGFSLVFSYCAGAAADAGAEEPLPRDPTLLIVLERKDPLPSLQLLLIPFTISRMVS